MAINDHNWDCEVRDGRIHVLRNGNQHRTISTGLGGFVKAEVNGEELIGYTKENYQVYRVDGGGMLRSGTGEYRSRQKKERARKGQATSKKTSSGVLAKLAVTIKVFVAFAAGLFVYVTSGNPWSGLAATAILYFVIAWVFRARLIQSFASFVWLVVKIVAVIVGLFILAALFAPDEDGQHASRAEIQRGFG